MALTLTLFGPAGWAGEPAQGVKVEHLGLLAELLSQPGPHIAKVEAHGSNDRGGI